MRKKVKQRCVPKEAAVIGCNLRLLRRKAGLSLQEMAPVLGVSQQQIQKYETGYNRFPVEKLFALRVFYGVPYEAFFQGMPGEEAHDVLAEWALFSRLKQLPDEGLRKKILKVLEVLMG